MLSVRALEWRLQGHNQLKSALHWNSGIVRSRLTVFCCDAVGHPHFPGRRKIVTVVFAPPISGANELNTPRSLRRSPRFVPRERRRWPRRFAEVPCPSSPSPCLLQELPTLNDIAKIPSQKRHCGNYCSVKTGSTSAKAQPLAPFSANPS